jgi:hypothetical protein
MDDERTLVVMRLADMWKRHPDQDDTKLCGMCGSAVGIYPSGQTQIRLHPQTKIVCFNCVDFAALGKEIDLQIHPAALSATILKKEMEESVVVSDAPPDKKPWWKIW